MKKAKSSKVKTDKKSVKDDVKTLDTVIDLPVGDIDVAFKSGFDSYIKDSRVIKPNPYVRHSDEWYAYINGHSKAAIKNHFNKLK